MPLFKKYPRSKTALAFVVLALTFYFLIKTLVDYYVEVRLSLRQISLPILGISLILFILYFNFRALSWRFIVKSLGKNIQINDALAVWFLGESTRYLPGKVWSFVSRVYLAEQKGVPKPLTLLSLALEIFLILLVTFIFSFQALVASYRLLLSNLHLKNLPFFLLLGGIILLLFVVRAKRKTIVKTLGNFSFGVFFKKDFLNALLFQALAWICFGLGTIVLTGNFKSSHTLSLLISNAVLSWLIGYTSLLTPMGLGIRESAITILFGQLLGSGAAVLLALLARLMFTLAEITNLGFWLIVKKGEGLTLRK